MVTPDPFVDLVHRELDGELSPAEQEELNRLLAADSALRDFRQRLRHLHQALEQVPDVEPPAGMRGRVLEAAAFVKPRPRARGGRDVSDRGEAGPGSRLRRQAAPLAAGLAIGTILTAWWLGGTGPAGIDPAAVSGAMGASATRGALLDSQRLGLEGLEVRADLHSAGAAWDLVLHVQAKEIAEVAIVCGSGACDIRGFAWLEGAGEGEARLEADRLTVPVTGSATLAARLENPGKAALVEFFVAGEPRGHLVLEPGRPGGGNRQLFQ